MNNTFARLMANVFISYNRQSKSIVRTLVRDIEALGN